jgi:uncharacterized protein
LLAGKQYTVGEVRLAALLVATATYLVVNVLNGLADPRARNGPQGRDRAPLDLGFCPSCRRVWRPAARFCTHCGYSSGGVSGAATASAAGTFQAHWARLQRIGTLFMLLLACSFLLGLITRGDHSPRPVLIMSVIDALVVAAFALMEFKELKPWLRAPHLDGSIALQVLLAIGVFVVTISAYFKVFDWAGGTTLKFTDRFLDAHWPMWSVYLVISVAPAIVEEITFRGIIQGSLERMFSVRDAWLIQGALFGLLHLSPFMFPSHFLMGLCFGFIRNRTKSLYPSMLVHGSWNAWIIFSEIRL